MTLYCYCDVTVATVAATAAKSGTERAESTIGAERGTSAAVADPGGVQGVQTPALLFRCPFLKRTF